MADLKISQLPVASTPLAGTELVPIVQGGTTDQTTVEAILKGTVPSGTANGVLFLNGSKAVSSGGGFTYNGATTVSISSAGGGYLQGAAGEILAGQDAGGFYYGTGFSVNPAIPIFIGNSGATFFESRVATAASYRWFLGAGESMRLNSTGLGVGNSNPGYKLDVAVNQANTTVNALRLINSNNSATPGVALLLEVINPSSGATIANNYASGAFYLALSTRDDWGGTLRERYRIFTNNSGAGVFHQWFRSDGSEAMRLDVSGNLGLGVTPSAWFSGYRAIEIGTALGAYNFSTNSGFAFNAADDGSWKYRTTAFAGRYIFHTGSGYHAWLNAPSGTAGNAITFTQAMTLDASGNLGIGATSPTQLLHVRAANVAAQPTILVNEAAASYEARIGVDNGSNGWVGTANSTNFLIKTVSVRRFLFDTSGNMVCGNGALATNATNGFLYVPSCAGTPTGTPGTQAGTVPIVVDSTNNKLYFYSGGAWRDAGP